MPKVHAAVIKLSNGRIGASMGGGPLGSRHHNDRPNER
jgi:hypothetical protein